MPNPSAKPSTPSPAAPARRKCVAVTSADRATLRLPWKPLIRTKTREWWIKSRGHYYQGQGLVGADMQTVNQGFGELHGADFEKYNYPQKWVERRQMPLAIDGRVPEQGADVLDLGCGPGFSTEVLAYFAHPSWNLIGYDMVDHYIETARGRSADGQFKNRTGETIRPRFVCQDISEPLRHPDGGLVRDDTVDFAISGGVVGLYLSLEACGRLARNLQGVLRVGGHAAIDTGPAISGRQLRRIFEEAGFRAVQTCPACLFDPRPKIVFQRQG